MRNVVTIVLFILIVGLAFFGMKGLIKFGPKAEKSAPKVFLPSVVVDQIAPENHSVVLKSQGEVMPKLEVSLSAEVSGRIIDISPQYVIGGKVSKGETILQIDAADYEARLSSARSTLAESELALETEKAKAIQAKRDWEKLGRGREATPLVMRVPQLAAARARVDAARASIAQAERDVDKTAVTAPFDCLIVAKGKDLGAFVNRGERIAELQSVTDLELRLPLSMSDYGFLLRSDNGDVTGEVTLYGQLGLQEQRWNAVVVRSEGTVDEKTRSVFVVAKIEANENTSDVLPPTGMFLQAEIAAQEIESVYAIPREAFADRDLVYIIDEQQKLKFLRVDVVLRTEQTAFIRRSGGEVLNVVVSPVATPIDGMNVQVASQETNKKVDKAAMKANQKS